MAGIKEYDTTAGNNSTINSIDISEGCAPSGINNAIRQVLADSRSQWNDANWFEYGDGDGSFTIAYASGTSFTVNGIDVTSIYHAGRRVRAVGSSTGTIYGTISSSSFSTNTTVNVTWDSGSLSNESLTIALSILNSTNSGIPVLNQTVDINGNELILDADADSSITADTDDQIDIKAGGTDVASFKTANLLLNVGAYNAESTLTDGATISWDASTDPVAKVTLGGNRTLGAASNGQAGQFVSLLVIQDGTGSRTLTWNAAYEFASDTAPTLTTTASQGDLFVFRYNGSKWLEVGRNLNLTLS
tara:strand:- start:1799 stop:2707 length:909 start_codon:yes stop_codon:yes gene_type:complete